MAGEHEKRHLARAAELPTKAALDERARIAREREWHRLRLAAFIDRYEGASARDPLEAAKADYVEGRIDHEAFELRVGEILQ